MSFIADKMLLFYKKYISSATPNTCIYVPSCSSYAQQAIGKYGFILGCIIGFWRILRCNPFAKGGFDPVKENYRGKVRWLI